jgi:hypothetical protein
VDAGILEEVVAAILRINVKVDRVLPGYIGTVTWTRSLNHRRGVAIQPIYGDMNGELKLKGTAFL